jgi:hypothetical protein
MELKSILEIYGESGNQARFKLVMQQKTNVRSKTAFPKECNVWAKQGIYIHSSGLASVIRNYADEHLIWVE